MATVSFIRTVATRAVFLRRMSPTCIATSLDEPQDVSPADKIGIHYANCQSESLHCYSHSHNRKIGRNTDVLAHSYGRACVRRATSKIDRTAAGIPPIAKA